MNQEILQILQNNLGNRLTPELIVGMHASLSKVVEKQISEAVAKQLLINERS